MNKSFANPQVKTQNAWGSDFKRTYREMRGTPDSLSDYSPMRSCMRLTQAGQAVTTSSRREQRNSPFRFVHVNAKNPDGPKDPNISHMFKGVFG